MDAERAVLRLEEVYCPERQSRRDGVGRIRDERQNRDERLGLPDRQVQSRQIPDAWGAWAAGRRDEHPGIALERPDSGSHPDCPWGRFADAA
jgi:hypothetical protein